MATIKQLEKALKKIDWRIGGHRLQWLIDHTGKTTQWRFNGEALDWHNGFGKDKFEGSIYFKLKDCKIETDIDETGGAVHLMVKEHNSVFTSFYNHDNKNLKHGKS